jgi:8-oxo-dGTP diphosphatase
MSQISVTVDIVIFRIIAGDLHVLLVKRKYPPFKNKWAIPGGFLLPKETLEKAALRELKEETGVSDVYLEQLYTFGGPKRDPRGNVVTVAYIALIPSSQEITLSAGTDAAEAQWFDAFERPPLAFDHDTILDYGIERLRNKFEWTTASFKLLPEKFSLTELQQVYEAVLAKKLDKRNFRRKVLQLDILTPHDEYVTRGTSRPAQLYSFSEPSFAKLKDKGILFPF